MSELIVDEWLILGAVLWARHTEHAGLEVTLAPTDEVASIAPAAGA